MVLKREMEIEIGRDGKVNIKVKGVQGVECLEFSQFLEEALGETVYPLSEGNVRRSSAYLRLKRQQALR